MELKDTEKLMESIDYKDRFKAEYYQTKIRYEKLKKYANKIEVEYITGKNITGKKVEHDCPLDMLREQQRCMGQYLHVLELRAEIEGVEL